jgi:hypothetical protein
MEYWETGSDFTQENGRSPKQLPFSGLLGSEWWWEITDIRCVTTEKSAVFSYLAAEVRNHGYFSFQNAQTYS